MNQTIANETFSVPPVDVFEGDHGFKLFADLPGVELSDVSLDFHGGVLSLDARRGPLHFQRSLRFGPDVNAEGLKASLRSGVLEVELPKVEKAKPRRIQIQAG